jgi:hypothetical protein
MQKGMEPWASSQASDRQSEARRPLLSIEGDSVTQLAKKQGCEWLLDVHIGLLHCGTNSHLKSARIEHTSMITDAAWVE